MTKKTAGRPKGSGIPRETLCVDVPKATYDALRIIKRREGLSWSKTIKLVTEKYAG
jgi:hypothetical protein